MEYWPHQKISSFLNPFDKREAFSVMLQSVWIAYCKAIEVHGLNNWSLFEVASIYYGMISYLLHTHLGAGAAFGCLIACADFIVVDVIVLAVI